MKYITQATEKRIKDMVKQGHKYGEALQQILDDMKGREGWYGSTIKEMKTAGYSLENETQIKVSRYYEYLYNGLTIMYNGLFYATFTLGLNIVNIYDFNTLVKKVAEMENKGYGTY